MADQVRSKGSIVSSSPGLPEAAAMIMIHAALSKDERDTAAVQPIPRPGVRDINEPGQNSTLG